MVAATGIMRVLPHGRFQKLYIYSRQSMIHLCFEEQKSVSVQTDGLIETERYFRVGIAPPPLNQVRIKII